MKKICIITAEISPHKGGIQNWMFFIKKLLKTKKYEVKHFAYKEDKFWHWFNIINCDTLLLATWKMAFFALPILYFTKKNCIIFVHGSEILNLKFAQTKLFALLLKRKHTYFVANSQAIADVFASVAKQKIDFVQFPFIQVFNQIKTSDDGGGGVLNFFTVARLIKRKNIANTIMALDKLAKENAKFKYSYTIAGDGGELNNLKKIVQQLSLGDKITFLGKINTAQKYRLYQESDFFLMPSIYDKNTGSIEGYGIVYIEANVCAIPVLGGDTGGMTESIINGITGLNCDGSINDICRKINQLTTISWDKNLILAHAKKHTYLQQDNFVEFLASINYE